MQKEKVINIEVDNIVTFAVQYLSFIDPFNHLSDGEKEVLARIMTNDVAFYDDDIREKLLLDYDVKVSLMEQLSITEARLNNIITSLRKKNVLVKTKSGNNLHPAYDMRFVEFPFTLSFKWTPKVNATNQE